MAARLVLVSSVALAACGRDAVPAAPPSTTPGLVAIPLDTDPGLSDLAVDADGALWTVSERGRSAYRIVLDGDRLGSLERFAVTNLPDGVDVEAIAVVGPSRFALGTEGHDQSGAAVWFAPRGDHTLDARGGFDLPASLIGVDIAENKGVEGVCGDGQLIVASLETVVEADGARWAPIVAQRTDVARDLLAPDVHRVRLTSATGKISAMTCAMGETELEILAIERHFEVSRLISFRLPRHGAIQVEATLAQDLTDLAAGRNFEGVARLGDGRVALIVDNQWKTITGPSELIILSAPL